MYILDKIDNIFGNLNESGIRNIRQWAKKFDKAVGYYHQDTDGVTSALAFKNYLENNGIKTVKVHMIQYGGRAFAVDKPPKGTLVWMVDFALSKPQLHLWTDHHDSQHLGSPEQASTSFVSAPANATHISMNISPREIFPSNDLKVISTVDSADFASQGLTPDDIMRSAFKLNKSISVKNNHKMMGLVTNSLLLANKNKKGFLDELVMSANPSLISMYNTIVKLSKKYGYAPPEEIEKGQEAYNQAQVKKIVTGKIGDIKSLKSGQSILINNVVCQYGGGVMGMNKGMQYNRYTVFKNHPDANFLCMIWPMGLLQISANPFKSGKSPIHLGDLLLKKVLGKYKSMLQKKMVTLDNLKRIYEMDIEKKGSKDSFGFTFIDLINTFKPNQIQGVDIEKTGKWKDIVNDITNKQWGKLSYKQKNILKKISISAYDIIMSQSGGHYSISNLTNLNLLGKGYVDTMKKIAMDAVKEMSKLKLGKEEEK